MKKGIYIFLIFIFCLFLTGCNNTKTYTSHGMSIEMPKGFYEKSLASTTVYFESQTAIVTGLKETFQTLSQVGLDKNSSLQDYLKLVLKNNNKEETLKEEGNLVYFTYESNVSGKDFFYTTVGYKANDSFWLFNFACETKNKDNYASKFLDWAKTVKFD